jgi:hypothetical protein
MSARQSGPVRGRAPTKKRIGTAAFIAVMGLIILFVGYNFAAPWLQQIDQQWMRCEVHTANPVRSGSRVTSFSVKLETNCGPLWFDNGIDAGNVNSAARQFVPHTDYDFRLGWLSRLYLQFGWSGATAEAWRRAS